MYSLFICEDDLVQLKILKDFVEKYILFHDEFLLASVSQNPQTILEYVYEKKIHKGIYILDVNLNNQMTGIDLAEKIRTLDPQAKLIFITSHEELAPLTLNRRVEALDYIVKSNSIEDIRRRLIENITLAKERLVEIQEAKEKNFSFSVGKMLYKIDVEDVFFLEPSKRSHKLILHTKTGHFEFYGSLNEYEKKYPQLFRSSKNRLVNPEQIVQVDFLKREMYFSDTLVRKYSVGKGNKLKEVISI